MKQGEIWQVNLNPAKGSEQAGVRPVVIISGNLMNTHLPVIIACPLTTKIKRYKGTLLLEPNDINQLTERSEILTFHIRSVSKYQFLKKIGQIEPAQVNEIKSYLNDILRY